MAAFGGRPKETLVHVVASTHPAASVGTLTVAQNAAAAAAGKSNELPVSSQLSFASSDHAEVLV